ncbi:MAG: potassium channel family protein [Woeseiaceae bacterium]
MLILSAIGCGLIAITVVIHAIGTTAWVEKIRAIFGDRPIAGRDAIVILIFSALIVFLLHALEIVVWAVAYMALVPDAELATFEEAVYFSFVTFTTLGYGDITLSEGFRLLSGIEALNGIILVGWTTAMIFAVVQRIWHSLANEEQ